MISIKTSRERCEESYLNRLLCQEHGMDLICPLKSTSPSNLVSWCLSPPPPRWREFGEAWILCNPSPHSSPAVFPLQLKFAQDCWLTSNSVWVYSLSGYNSIQIVHLYYTTPRRKCMSVVVCFIPCLLQQGVSVTPPVYSGCFGNIWLCSQGLSSGWLYIISVLMSCSQETQEVFQSMRCTLK